MLDYQEKAIQALYFPNQEWFEIVSVQWAMYFSMANYFSYT